jgi:Domain of unknown function (DUF927)
VARRRYWWKKYQNRIDPGRLVFIDETWTKTNMAPLRGWGDKGERLRAFVPHGHWKTLRGTSESWSNEVGRRALKSSRVMTAISAPFAASLLRPLNIRPFGIAVYGETRDGKTTAEIAVASVIGVGTEQELPKRAMTEAALHEACRVYNDLVLPLDDIAPVRGNAKVKYQTVHDMAYRFSIGGQIRIFLSAKIALKEGADVGVRLLDLLAIGEVAVIGQEIEEGEDVAARDGDGQLDVMLEYPMPEPPTATQIERNAHAD